MRLTQTHWPTPQKTAHALLTTWSDINFKSTNTGEISQY